MDRDAIERLIEAEKAEAVREAVEWCALLAERYAEAALREAQEAETPAATTMNLDKARAAHTIVAAIRDGRTE